MARKVALRREIRKATVDMLQRIQKHVMATIDTRIGLAKRTTNLNITISNGITFTFGTVLHDEGGTPAPAPDATACPAVDRGANGVEPGFKSDFAAVAACICEPECDRWRPGSNGGARLDSIDPAAGVDDADDDDDPCPCPCACCARKLRPWLLCGCGWRAPAPGWVGAGNDARWPGGLWVGS